MARVLWRDGSYCRAPRLRRHHRVGSRFTSLAAVFGLLVLVGPLVAPLPASAATVINGTGSSFAGTQWITDVSHTPYSLNVNYATSSSDQGRYEFTNETADFAVSDLTYSDGDNSGLVMTAPTFPFTYVPITGAGVAFMYNIPGLTQTLQLTSYTICMLLTGQITNWDDPALHLNGSNTGITLPNLAVKPVTENDAAGTNFALESYCIDEQPAVWAKYAQNMSGIPPPSGVAISATTPGANWQAPGNGYDEQNTFAVASNVANTSGSIGAVQEDYAAGSGFTGSNPAKAVAAVQNASGDYTLPTPLDVTSALTYDAQAANGEPLFDFNGLGPNVYNPSTYSYLLTPTTGWSSAKGAVMSAFLNYALTLGQQEAPKLGEASLGAPLEQYGINEVNSNVPGAVTMTAAEQAFYSCGDLTQSDVAAGLTTSSCSPGTGTPEVAAPLLLPLLALALGGIGYGVKRRRDRRRTEVAVT
jgi:phosphate transport system substrate-binding protein